LGDLPEDRGLLAGRRVSQLLLQRSDVVVQTRDVRIKCRADRRLDAGSRLRTGRARTGDSTDQGCRSDEDRSQGTSGMPLGGGRLLLAAHGDLAGG
jgi:hypothetical protein